MTDLTQLPGMLTGAAKGRGVGWAYSNPGYMLLKRVAEGIEDLAALAPGTSCALSPDGVPRDVRAHYHPGWVSHGVVASTASEVVRFLDGPATGRREDAPSARREWI